MHGTTPAHCATEPSLYTPLLPGLGGRLFILYVTKLIIQLLTDYRRPETRLKYINISNIMETERRRRISFSVWILQTLQSSVSTSYIYRYRICGAPHNNVYFIGNLYRRVTCVYSPSAATEAARTRMAAMCGPWLPSPMSRTRGSAQHLTCNIITITTL